ncbi:WEB family protein At2g40480-like [Cynara cardunculus var. scolymus]|uniref:WEB family protein At2g40480-like n=1 Tax=Cynara cardunculus var. scolymus TaxID=59895 RepID=UPI000D62E135|nr:WEB family protein At2g40480-like [Cynara cardunculus var. scolymus]
MNPRVEIDTSPPFGSVKEAVTRFGGSGSWIPLHVLRLAGHDVEEMDMETVEKQAAELEKELIIKEQETLEVLRDLESAKGVMEGLKINLMKEVSTVITALDSNPDSGTTTPVDQSSASFTLCPVPLPPGIILTELKAAKSNLNKTTNDLALIRASVESLNKKLRTHKANLLDKEGETKRVIEETVDISHGLTFEAQQFRKMEEAAQYEVIKATSEIEHTKMSIRMVEMRLIAAKKMEEAARAMEAVANAENNGDKPLIREGITLSYEEYSALAQKAQKAEEICKKNDGGNELSYHRKDANLSTMAFLKNSIEHADDARRSRKTLEEALGPRSDAANGRNLESRNGFFRERSDDIQTRKSTHNHPKTRNPYPFYGHAPRNFGPLMGDDSNVINKESRPVLRSSVSIGDILSRKLILQDNIVVGEDVESQSRRDDVSLSEMLREQSGLIFHESRKADKEGRIDKQFFTQRKKFGFIHVSLPLKQNKKKSNSQPPQPLNMRYP